MPSTTRTARDLARETITAQLLTVARRHLAETGAAGLSLRAVARDLGMASSAVYRYVASRDDLLTRLIVEAYESVADAAERADAAAAGSGADAGARYLAVARAVRAWGHAQPHEYALIYGSPVPGYRAPQDTVAPAVRMWAVLAGIVRAGIEEGSLRPADEPFEVDGLVDEQVVRAVGPTPPAEFVDVTARMLVLFSGLVGAVSAELFGHFHGFTADLERLFDVLVATTAEGVGLRLPVPRQDDGQPA